MKKVLNTLLVVLVSVIYLIGTMGMGVHHCLKEQSYKVILFAGESPCDHQHHESQHHDHQHHESQHHDHHDSQEVPTQEHHDGSCCQTSVYVISSPSVVVPTDSRMEPDVVAVWALPCTLVSDFYEAPGFEAVSHSFTPPDVFYSEARFRSLPLRL